MNILNFFKQNNINLKNKKIVIAASGGPDSMALVDMLNRVKDQTCFDIIVAHFDHQLRIDSKDETRLLKNYCDQNDLFFENQCWPVDQHPASGIEASAREARYDYLIKVMKKYNGDYLLTAHHGDDLLENILLKLIRSGNPQEMNSLQVIGKMKDITLIRPLITYSKKQLLEYDHQNNIAYIEDSTNKADDTLRNRIRHHIVPLLKKENAGILKNAARFSKQESTLSKLANKEVSFSGKVESFLEVAYRIKGSQLETFSSEEQLYFWRNFIWQTWHRRVNDHLQDFNLIKYQGYFYLLPKNIPKLICKKEVININKTFVFRGQKFLISNNKQKDWPLIGDFWSNSATFRAGSILPKNKLLLKNGQHVRPKKMFAQAGIPHALRDFCLSIFDENDEVLFIEKTFKEQVWQKNGKHYFIYQLKNI